VVVAGGVVPVCAALIPGEHPGVLLVGTSGDCCPPGGLRSVIGADLRERLLRAPDQQRDSREREDPPEVGADEPDQKQDADKLPDDPRHSAMLGPRSDLKRSNHEAKST